ncbi:hypothetical protein WMY93_030908 [Mugilogobius chulae]|uniref:Claudin n=1 Tax=Mugilogobius chulae TaxID=88201 RepID=A0AAW0MQH5_9GOBI
MWRETSFVGANVVTAQSVWDGLWLHCVVQATGQMQCKRHTAPSLTADLQAGRALTLVSLICGFLGFMVALLGGGVVNCTGEEPDPNRYYESRNRNRNRSTRKKACILGGALCALSGVLCLIPVSWSAGVTTFISNDPLVIAAMKRDVGSSVYIGLVSSALLLLSALLIGLVCWDKDVPPPSSDYSHYTYTDNAGTQRTHTGSNPKPNKTSRYVYPDNSLYKQAVESYSFPYYGPHAVML